ncbi:carbonic anhydrase [Verrucomicrobiales bacterium]|nr:carbonic anhydrase [Verrucomicrobiales bacterium]MDC0259268.1 carbonic anhydrase [Verrucomicrobiales bacterium]MDC0276589.1 carbonic anhydrase [Verrucomicrobiales bacterium]
MNTDCKKNEIPALEALNRLREGNRRYALDLTENESVSGRMKRYELADGQQPFAIILGCSDSRVPVELIFDQGLGDLFVIRVAGNIVAPSQIGSVEFAASQFGTQLVVVLGHSKCGAIQATLDEIRRPTENQSKNLKSIVNRIGPALSDLVNEHSPAPTDEVFEQAVRANIRSSVYHLSHGSEIIETMQKDGELLVVGAEYNLKTGRVEFFDLDED